MAWFYSWIFTVSVLYFLLTAFFPFHTIRIRWRVQILKNYGRIRESLDATTTTTTTFLSLLATTTSAISSNQNHLPTSSTLSTSTSTTSASSLLAPLLSLGEQVELSRSLMKENSVKQEQASELDKDLFVAIEPTPSNSSDSKVVTCFCSCSSSSFCLLSHCCSCYSEFFATVLVDTPSTKSNESLWSTEEYIGS